MICNAYSEVSCERQISLTLEDGTNVFPDGYAATAVELTKGQLHVEQRNPTKHSHQQVRQQEST